MADLERWQIALAMQLVFVLTGAPLLPARQAGNLAERYLRVRALLRPCAEQRQFSWRRARHAHRAYRSAIKIAALAGYLLSCMLAFLPLVTWMQVHGPQWMPVGVACAQALVCLALLGLALYLLRLGRRIEHAEALLLR